MSLALPLGLAAQSAPPGAAAGDVQWISPQQYQEMVRAGTLVPVTPRTLLDQQVAALETDLVSRAIVDEYLRQHPELIALRRLVQARPDFGRERANGGLLLPARGDGYAFSFVNQSGQRQTFEMMGQQNKLSVLAHSIRQLELPAVQLQLYTALYNQLPPGLCQPVGVADSGAGGDCSDLPAPQALQNASLDAIQLALHALTGRTASIVALIPHPLQLEPIGCAADVGNNNSPSANVTWGDQTSTTGCPPPSAGGIYANFNFPNKGLISCIKNQGHRGTCHIFAATSALEELVARDTNTFVNLNEQDFQEHVKLAWEKNAPDLYNDNGSSGQDLTYAINNNYRFAYENQWDYNPSLYEPVNTYQNTCEGYPGAEPGCSDTAPQAPRFCASTGLGFQYAVDCGYALADLPGARSPYSAVAVSDVWNPADPQQTFDYMILGLAFNNAVLLGFNVTDDFQGAPDGYVPYLQPDLGTTVGGHMVHVVGYVSNDDLAANVPTAPAGDGGGYFIIKNSWGACTGDAGYYYMPVSYLLAEANEVDIVSSVGH